MPLARIRVKGTKLQMQQADDAWREWEGTLVGASGQPHGTLWIHDINLHYIDNAGDERYVFGLDGGLTASLNKIWAGTCPTSGARYLAWIDMALHSRTGHSDTAHDDHTDDVVHGDVAHVDTHTDTHTDTAHTNVPHSDSHTDAHGDTPYDDYAHGDVAYTDHTDGYHIDYHGDSPHTDIPYVDWHSDVAHSDVAYHYHAHVDTHGDVAHVDTHTDTAAYTDHGDTAHIDLPSVMP